MKKITAILFISALLFMQYSKQFAYLSCKLENINATQNCNCESVLTEINQQKNTDTPLEKHNHSITTEEYVEVNLFTNTALHYNLVLNKPAAYTQSFCLQRYANSLLRPPTKA